LRELGLRIRYVKICPSFAPGCQIYEYIKWASSFYIHFRPFSSLFSSAMFV
jgi:hypothetical protein